MTTRNNVSRGLSALSAVLLCQASLLAADWPQWRGPNRDDISTERGLLKSWPEGGPQRMWMFTNCGVGYGGPAIVGGKLYIMGARDGQELLLAIDADRGEELWATPIGEVYENRWGDGPRGTPTVDGEFIFALGAQGNLICARADNGAVQWTVSMQQLGGELPTWGFAESPLVYQNKVICTPGGAKGAVAALDKATGAVIWQTDELNVEAHYSSVVAADHQDHKELVQLLANQLVGIDPDSGKVLWSEGWPGQTAVIPTPVVRGNFVYCTSSYGAGCMLLEIGADHAARKIYENKVMKNKHGGVILVGDHIYGHSEGVAWICHNFRTGEVAWRHREFGMGAIAYADDRFYCLDERTGDIALIEASPEAWREHGRFRLEPQSEIRKPEGRIWTHPVISGGKLYLRDQDLLYCYDVRDTRTADAAR